MKTVKLYVLSIDEIKANALKMKAALDDETLKKIDGISSEKAALEKLGSSYLVAKFTGDNKVFFGERGKPLKRGVFFNASHDGGIVAMGVADCDIGVDVCALNRFERAQISRVFSEEEIASAGKKSDLAFFWVQKESLLKCDGAGICAEIKSVPCGDGERFFGGKRYYSRTFEYFNCAICITLSTSDDIIEYEIIEPL